MVNMKVLRIFETNNFPFGVILIRTSLLFQKSVGLEEHGVARLLGRRRHCKDLIGWRSEEHTSELQSHSDLVCRLLLEKKKNIALILDHVDMADVVTMAVPL